jgi:hypothetical protein
VAAPEAPAFHGFRDALKLGAPPPQGADGRRALKDGRVLVYWADKGLSAVLDKAGAVVGFSAESPDSDPFFRQAYEGKTREGFHIGAKAADMKSKLAACSTEARPSPFVAGRVVVTCKAEALSLDLSGPGGSVIAMRVGAQAL